jgi:hypothetical protein
MSVSSNDSVNDTENIDKLPISITTKTEETPSSSNNDKKNRLSTDNQQNAKIKPSSDKFFHAKTEKKVNPILPNINEIDEFLIDNQEETDIEKGYNKSVFTTSNGEIAHILPNINEINGYFTENKGQVNNNSVRFYIQGSGVWFLDDCIVFEIFEKQEKSIISKYEFDINYFDPKNTPIKQSCQKIIFIKLYFEGANRCTPKGRRLLPFKSNFFYGNDSSKWCTDVQNYREILYKNLYENIDLRYYTTDKGLKYDFIVHPGGNPNDIRLRSEGANKLLINTSGDLIIQTNVGNIIDSNLFIYQNHGGMYNEINGKFEIMNYNKYKFNISNNYLNEKDLIIDPGLIFSTYVGAKEYDWGTNLDVDANGNTYVIGSTQSSSFPTTTGVYDTSHNGNDDIFVFKLNHNGSKLLYSTFIGGKSLDDARNIKIDSNNDTYVTGRTFSSDFPTTTGAYDTSFNKNSDIFILKLNNKGSILKYSTFIGGNSVDHTISLKLDSSGNAYVTGSTYSNNFPTTINAYDKTYNGYGDVCVLKLNSLGSKLLYSSFIGRNNSDIGIDMEFDLKGNIFVTGYTYSTNFPITSGAFDKSHNGGYDVFILKLNLTKSSLIYSTFIGGGSNDYCSRIKVDHLGNASITGVTISSNFPTTVGAFDTSYNNGDAFILKLNSNGSNLIYSTYIGGKVNDWSYDLEVDPFGNAIITGGTYSSDFPITSCAYDATINGKADVFVLKLNKNGSKVINSTFIGGSQYDVGRGIEFDTNGNYYVTGFTESSDFPTTTGAFDNTFNGAQDCLVFKLRFGIKNTAPKISSFTASKTPEGSEVIFTVNASDPENDTLTYSFDFQNNTIFDYIGKNNSASYIWGDDYNGTATVRVSDGVHSVKAKTRVKVYNVAPSINLSVSARNGGRNATMAVRIAGEKWHDVIVELYRNGTNITNGSLIRCPGSPNDQMLYFSNHSITSSGIYSAILRYTPKDDPVNGKPNGATPCWIILNLSNGTQIKLHHTFKVKQKDTHIWRVNLTEVLPYNGNSSRKGTFNITVFDPGSDNITLYLDFGDGTNITKFYPNNNQTFPVSFNLTLFHDYTSSGTYSFILIAKDDDGGITTVKVTLDFG